MTERWIVIPNWHDFQHYKNRTPVWIKNYTELMADDGYLSLTLRQRGILHGIWLLMAQSRLVLGASPARLGSMLGDETVRARDLEALNHAGFIAFSASKPLADRYQAASPEVEKSKNPPTPSASRKNGTSPRQRGTNPRAEPAPSFACGIDGCPGVYKSQAKLDEHRELAHIAVAVATVDSTHSAESAPIDEATITDDDLNGDSW